jgi:DNA primase
MRYPPSFLDEIRSRLPVSRVVGRRVKLKRAGREYIGLSPFKIERTPSFTVNDQKGFYHCFASGEHGDIFKFVMATEGLSFAEAVERLAGEAGVQLPAPVKVDAPKEDREERLRAALEEACLFFEAALFGRPGAEALAYLEQRGIQLPEIRAFRLGFAPNAKSDLKSHLAGRGFTLDEMQDAGLLVHGEDIAVPYDRFRGRIIFPIADAKGRIIAFGGRAILPDQQPKYLNSPDTPLFHKGHILFNMAAAREQGRQKKQIVVAEGYMDVIALSRAGYPNAVAPLGTALTPDQLRLLWALCPVPTLCFDGDAAGRKAAHRALDCALPFLEPGRSLQFTFLPDGRDPDDMVRAGAGNDLAKLLEAPVPLVDVLWDREMERHPIDLPEHRALFEARLTELAHQINHQSLRFHYMSALRERFRSLLRPAGAKGTGRQGAPWQRSARRAGTPQAHDRAPRTASLLKSRIAQPHAPIGAQREALILTALINHPWLLEEFPEDIAHLPLGDPDCTRLRQVLLAVHQDEEHLDNQKLLEHLSRAGVDAEARRILNASLHRADAHFDPKAQRELVLEGWHHIVMLHGKAGVPRSLQEAESEYLNNPTSENFIKLRAVVQDSGIAAG